MSRVAVSLTRTGFSGEIHTGSDTSMFCDVCSKLELILLEGKRPVHHSVNLPFDMSHAVSPYPRNCRCFVDAACVC